MSTIDDKVLNEFYAIISDSKKEMFDRIAAQRTRHVVVAMENIQKDHNASAVLRTCDCFGVQDLYTIEKNKQYEIQREIARGSGNWVDLHSYTEGEQPELDCLNDLKQKGYRIIATSPSADKTIQELDITTPIALFFGTEWHGISETVESAADELVKIPMYGFTESFNVSVTVALMLNILRERLQNSNFIWKLSEQEQTQLKIDWCSKIVNRGYAVQEAIRDRLLEKE